MLTRWHPYPLYLCMSAASAFLMSTIWVVGAVYYVLSVHMNPFQLVLVGTILEVSYLLFQVPTGLFADTYSRRLSIVLGGVIMGVAWIAEGLVPLFIAVGAAEAVRGLGAAFTDGAESAWLSDELGEERFGRASLRGSQIAQLAGIAGVPLGVALASIHLYLPMVVGGSLFTLVYLLLAFVMPERAFRVAPQPAVRRRTVMRSLLNDGVRLIRGRPLLLTIRAIAMAFGAFTEGFDRLWQAHFLRDFSFPQIGHLTPVVWFGIINVVVALLVTVVMQVVLRRLDMNDHQAVGQALLAVNALIILSVVAFGLAGSFVLAFASFAVARVMRQLNTPIYITWLNAQITDSRVRATVLSIQAGADSVGQSAFGPVIGLIGTIFSLRTAIVAAGLILVPALPLYASALRGGGRERVPLVADTGESAT